ncbi:PREDICTED: MPN domain-containing protein, partial [Gekko japonicus]|uniref:MPN domain-containing protein n=1 Tax=Gekko japonicus TaxID=146911 RepID=A0ABM1L1M8_GEKJA
MAAAVLDTESFGGHECLEEDEEELETSLEDPESEPVGKFIPGGRGCCILTRRGVTFRPGEGVLSIYYLGKKFLGDLLTDGKIVWQETGQVFNSPSAWATYCKKLVNPAKKSGCGWASVKYKGQKLDQYKAVWLKKYQPNTPPADEGLVSEGEEEELADDEEEETKGVKSSLSESMLARKLEEKARKHPNRSLAESLGTDNGKRPESKNCVPVRYCSLGSRDLARNPHTLVEVTSFAALNKFQPFNVAISSNVLLLLEDWPGKVWADANLVLIPFIVLTVLRAFPCRSRLGDAETAAAVEEEKRPAWFLACWDGFRGPYYPGNQGMESKISPFWVMPPPEQRPYDYGIPMEVEVTYIQDGFLTNDVLHEM